MRFDQQDMALRIVALIVSVLILGPILVLLRASLGPPGTLPFDGWGVTLAHYATIFTQPDNLRLAGNTLFYALASVAIGVAIATAIAWATERTDMPGRVTVRVMMFSWMAVPPLVMGFGWILLINPGNGALNRARHLGVRIQGSRLHALFAVVADRHHGAGGGADRVRHGERPDAQHGPGAGAGRARARRDRRGARPPDHAAAGGARACCRWRSSCSWRWCRPSTCR